MKSKPKISKAWDKMEIRNIQSAYDLKAERKTCKSEAMQMGDPQSGDRAAVCYTLMGNCHREGINAEAYLTDLFTRLPTETNQTVPANTQSLGRRIKKSEPAIGEDLRAIA